MSHLLIDSLQARSDEFVALRRDIHRHPELGLHEVRTSQRIAERLQAWGYEVTAAWPRPAWSAHCAAAAGRRRLGLRADMDALPIQESTGSPGPAATPA